MVDFGNIKENKIFFPKSITPEWKCKVKIFDKGTYSELNPYIINMNSQTIKSVEGSLPLSADYVKFSIFNIVARMDGNSENITMSDLAKLKKQFKNDNENSMLKSFGITNVKWDGNAGKGTIELNNSEVVIIDFETASETNNKKITTSGIKNNKKKVSSDMDYDGFVQDLALSESSGHYNAINRLGYLGRYQFGECALADIGMYEKPSKNYNNDWSGTFILPGRNGKIIRTKNKKAFLNSPAVQELALEKYMKKQWDYINLYGLKKYVGKRCYGFTVTESGLIAAAHLRGAKRLSEFFEELNKHQRIKNMERYRDANGKSVIDYMKDFAGYNIKEITQS